MVAMDTHKPHPHNGRHSLQSLILQKESIQG